MAADLVNIDLDDDYLTWERKEPITYHPAPYHDDVAVHVERAKRRAPTIKEQMVSGGVYLSTDLIWIIPTLEAPSLAEQFPPKPGDTVEDGDLKLWTVLSILPFGALSSFWRLVTRDLSLTCELRDAITILRPAITVGDAAEPVFVWPPDGGSYIAVDLPARVQPTTDGIGKRNEIETAQTQFNVIYDDRRQERVELRMGDRIVVTRGSRKGQVLRWVSRGNEDRIDELPYLVCERV